MCRTHSREEVAVILDTLADLFAWKRRKGLAEAAAVARLPSQGWPPAAPGAAAPDVAPAPLPAPLRDPQSA